MAGVSSRSLAYRIQRFAYYRSYFPSLGLWRDDLRRDTPVLKEALSRLPRTDVEGRNFRIARAVVLHNAKMMLPRDQWTELDDDKLYIGEIIEQIKKEIKEKEDHAKSK
ncbi:cytochrome b-c1 complex subunit 7-like isoform X2 [Ostrea edulis]|uniref:cytochrome b-c1 complex subunit 7-like isoform X2 n=1 Tax=Ostrea edulis TaxID=37623 RepID=UPI002094099B|nr:cytochrome b-c1 complex subunit 7-like isoform X2 [Ostrea edulis]